VRKLVERELYRRDRTGALVPRLAADIAYRLQSWYGIRGVNVAQVVEVLRTALTRSGWE
jgi:hypothetical protein